MEFTIRDLLTFHRTPHGKKLIRYTTVSVIGTVVSQLVLFVLFGGLHLVDAVWANIIANVVATPPCYYLTRNWVWGKSGRSHLMKEVVPFWALSFAGLVLSSITVGLADHFASSHHLSNHVHAEVVNGANLFGYGTLWILKFLVFNKMFHVQPVADGADLVEA